MLEWVGMGKKMRIKVLIIGLIILLATPVFADEFTLKKSSDDDTIFNLLQYSAWVLIDLDTVLTYRTINRYGLEAEATRFWRGILDKPALVFAIDMVIKVGIVWGTSKLYKKNKILAYAIIVLVNVVQIYCVNSHLKAWRK